MLYVDLPTRPEFLSLRASRSDACLSIYIPTTPLTQHVGASKTELSNLFRSARDQLEALSFDKRRLALLAEHIDDLLADDEFWRLQANSLAVLVTPDSLRTFRLANHLKPMVEVSDRFHVTPLLRALTFANTAYVLSLSENAVRLVEVSPDLPASRVAVHSLPRDAASAVGKATLNDRGPSGRIHGSEGQNVRLRQYARKVDAALRPVLAGRETPLILAANERLASIYHSVNSYPNLLDKALNAATDRSTDAELADAARAILDAENSNEIAGLRQQFEQRTATGRATADIADAARAATVGAIETLLVDIDAQVPGTIDDESGAVTFADKPGPASYDVLDEIAGRALSLGARVLGVRKADLPTKAPIAAILRFPVSG